LIRLGDRLSYYQSLAILFRTLIATLIYQLASWLVEETGWFPVLFHPLEYELERQYLILVEDKIQEKRSLYQVRAGSDSKN